MNREWSGMGHRVAPTQSGLLVPEHVLQERSDVPSLSQPIDVNIGPEGETEPAEEPFELPIEEQGDLITGDENGEPVILPVGEDGQVLMVDPTEPDGIAWREVLIPATEGGFVEPGGVGELVSEGLIEMLAIPRLIMCWVVLWGPGTISNVSLGGFNMSGTAFGNAWSVGSGPYVTQQGIEPAGRLVPGKINLKVTRSAAAAKVPFSVFMFTYNPPGTANRTGMTTGEPNTANPKTEVFALTTNCYLSTYVCVRAKPDLPTARKYTLLWNAAHALFNEAGNPTGANGFAEVDTRLLPPAGNDQGEWTFPSATPTKSAINNLQYT